MTIVEAILLGLIQGLTEFLPVSSSGHLELGKVFMEVKGADNLLFSVIVHGATALSTVVVFRRYILTLIKESFSTTWNESHQFILKIVISMIPVGIVGLFFKDQVETLFAGNLLLVSSMLIFTGLLLTFSHLAKDKEGNITFIKSLIIGIAQAVAIIPGISRSGATISTALLLGIDKEKATSFSFLMVLPPILGATLLEFLDYMKEPAAEHALGAGVLVIGFIAAFLAGLFACTWMLSIVKRGKLIYFAIYCFIIGIAVFLIEWI